MSQYSAALVGCTGLVGGHILNTLGNNASFQPVSALARRSLQSYSNVNPVIEGDSSKWTTLYAGLSPSPAIFFCALGTTRAIAGSLEKQRTIELDLNLSLARQAKESGTRIYVLISGGSANSKSIAPYLRMKGELEDEVIKLGFEHTVILRPGLLLGPRNESRPSEYAVQLIARGLGRLSRPMLTDFWAQTGEEVGKAAVKAGQECLEGKREPGVWILDQKQILELGRLN